MLGMRNKFRDVKLMAFLIPEVFASFFGNDILNRRASGTEEIPAPLVIQPSQYWDGDDGDWSSFALRVGTPSQNVRVLASTNSPETMVVLEAGCSTAAIKPVPDGCANARGGLFNKNSSTTWLDQGFYGINGDGIGLEANLGYTQNADYGLEMVGLGYTAGAQGPTLQNQTVAGIGSVSPIYVGVLGLSTQPVNYSTIGNFSAPSLFTSLRSQKLIPSLSWSYTAGAKYRLKAGQYAQLIFGGFDSSRFQSNSATFSLAGDIDRDIVLAIQSIVYSGTSQKNLLSAPIFAFIESTDVNIWLPASACRAFESAFGLTIDNKTGLYLMNSTQYSTLLTANPQVTFTLANSLSGGQTVNVVLPFSAFALPGTYPFVANSTRYFPLKTAANESQYTLGRTFLQEAYLTVDYERGNFSVSQCLWIDGSPAQLSTIISPTYKSTTNTTTINPTSTPAPTAGPPSPGLIAGVVLAILIVLAAIALGLLYFLRSKRRRTSTASDSIPVITPKEGEDSLPLPSHSHLDSHTLPPPYHKELSAAPSISTHVDAELASPADEIHQLPTPHEFDEAGGYIKLSGMLESQRRRLGTQEVEGSQVGYEMEDLGSPGGHEMVGSEVPRHEVLGSIPPVEMDDEGSRRGLVVQGLKEKEIVKEKGEGVNEKGLRAGITAAAVSGTSSVEGTEGKRMELWDAV